MDGMADNGRRKVIEAHHVRYFMAVGILREGREMKGMILRCNVSSMRERAHC